ncbi:MAG: DUF1254 domain-containing protein [Bauldia sp.]|nr:DUF1254 domain-containing protein [Bauldia sp.]
MRTALLSCLVVGLVCAWSLTAVKAAEDTRFIENETIPTIVGDLVFEKGFPTPETTARLFELRTFYRAIEVIQQNVFAASLYAMRKGYAEAGAGRPNQVIVFRNFMDAKSEFLTANNTTVYAMTFLDLKADGPTVIEAPPKLLGLLNDMWMRYIGDIGNAGPDKGAGGKFLILPPGYDGDVPDGYFVFPSKTYGVWVALRALADADGSTKAANERYEQLKIYPLSQGGQSRADRAHQRHRNGDLHRPSGKLRHAGGARCFGCRGASRRRRRRPEVPACLDWNGVRQTVQS